MKLKNIFLLEIITILLFIAGCKKDDDNDFIYSGTASYENVKLKGIKVKATTISLEWDNPDSLGYSYVLINWKGNTSNGIVNKSKPATTCLIKNLIDSMEYSFEVVAFDYYGNKSDTVKFNVTTSSVDTIYHFIYTINDLNAVRGGVFEDWKSYDSYILMNDLNMNDYVAADTSGWLQIGNMTSAFNGIFDGNGHVISNLVIKRPKTDYVGLFGYTNTKSVIKNLGLHNIYVSGGFATGGLVGYFRGYKLHNCFTTGTVNKSYGGAGAGGLAGYVEKKCTVSNCYSHTDVKSHGSFAGGLISVLYDPNASVTNCYATGKVYAKDEQAGGLIGTCYGGAIQNCFATGDVWADDSGGGLVGFTQGTISKCYTNGAVSGITMIGGIVGRGIGNIDNTYSTGNVSGTDQIGGIIGYYHNIPGITNCYSTGIITGAKANGIVGYVYSQSTITGCYFNKVNTGSWGGTGKTLDEMQIQSTFAGWDFSTIWGINSQINNGFPYLQGTVALAKM